jgi:nucleoside recognition membrane protein YjiH
LDFISEYLTLLLFAIILIILLVFIKKNRSLNALTSVYLVWISVAASLTLTYIVGIIDYGFFESSLLGFGKKDFLIILFPGVISLLILFVSGFLITIRKIRSNGKSDGGGR